MEANLVRHLTESILQALFLASLVSTTPALAACPCPPAELMAELELAYQAYTAFELERFSGRVEGIRARVTCLERPLTPAVAARLHLVQGLQAWLDQDPRSMAAAARAVFAVSPSFQPGPEIAPDGSRIRAVFETAALAEPGASQVFEGVALTLDGEPGQAELPTERAVLVQWSSPDGELRTWYLDGLGVPEALADQLRLLETPAPSVQHRSRWLLVGSGAAGLLGASSLWGAHRVKRAYLDGYEPTAEPRMYAANQALGYAGWALVGGAGLGSLGALWLWEF